MSKAPLNSETDGARRHITLSTIAEEAGVHKSTVSLALRNDHRITRETCKRIQKLATEMGYRPNPYVKAVMSHTRAGRKANFQGSMGFINTHNSRSLRNKFYTVDYIEGARTRAEELGFKLIEFYLQSPSHTPNQLRRMLIARNIHTLIIHHHPSTEIPRHELPIDLSPFSVVSIGSRLENPSFTYVATDVFYAASLAVTKAVKLGYRRIGLAVSGYVDYENEYRYSGGYYAALETYGLSQSIPVCFIESLDYREIRPWIEQFRPEIILGLNDEVPQIARETGAVIPDDMGWIHLDWKPGLNDWAAIDSRHKAIGQAAADIVVAQFNRNERGPSQAPRFSLIAGEWINGSTVARQHGVPSLEPRYRVSSIIPKRVVR